MGTTLGQPTPLKLSIANNQVIPCNRLWHGEITVGESRKKTYFVVFNCHGAFNVILGKPWLVKDRACPNYHSDTISIPTGPVTCVVENKEQGKKGSTVGISLEEGHSKRNNMEQQEETEGTQQTTHQMMREGAN